MPPPAPRLTQTHASAVLPQVDIDKQGEGGDAGLRQRNLGRRIDHRGDMRPVGSQDRQPWPGPRRQRRRNQQIGDAGAGICLGLADGLATKTDSAGGDLQAAERRTFVHLAVRPQPHAAGVARGLHGVQIGHQGSAADDQRRGLWRRDMGKKGGKGLHVHTVPVAAAQVKAGRRTCRYSPIAAAKRNRISILWLNGVESCKGGRPMPMIRCDRRACTISRLG